MSILLLIVNKFPTSMAAIGKEYPKIINTSRTWRKGRQTFLQGFRQRESFYAGSYLFTLIRSQYSTKQNKAWHTSFGLNCISTGNENSNFHISPFPFAESLRHSCVLEEKCLFFCRRSVELRTASDKTHSRYPSLCVFKPCKMFIHVYMYTPGTKSCHRVFSKRRV